ncbi:TonB-dependent receptor [uncultured Parabacteroides sp.]|uniref:TonB-dependent receptor n=3 Tax=Parabacteroides TaxID=375288 RepID=UPI0025DF027A|nr:TonB-dependent receptor [uncultured Parabacteroides sp.]
MKLAFVSIFIFASGIFATEATSQTAKVSIVANNISTQDLMLEIEKQTDYLFVYNENEVNLNRKVTIQATNQTVAEVLNKAFDQTDVIYAMEGSNIMLIKKETRNKTLSTQQKARTTNGIITDEKGEAIIGANVSVKGTTNGTITDVDGNFSLANISDNDIIVISYIGYTPQEIRAGKQTSLKVILKEDTQAIDEVVVVGFGTQKKVNLTGSIGTVKADEVLKSRPVTNVQELLAGSVPGMVVTKGSGAAGSGASINIRGISTIGDSSGVLVLIDGIPGNIYTLNPNDIESVSILKDAASAAIYGSRAANGVILVTTKGAKATERPTVEFSSNIGIQNPQFKLDFVGAEDFMRLYDQAMINDGKQAVYGEQGIQDLHAGKYVDNKWYKEIYKKNTVINNTHVALSGKEKSISYRFSISNDYQDGNLPNNNYNRLIFKPDMRFQILKNLEARASLQYTQTNIKNPNGGTTIWQTQAARISPVTPIYNTDGSYATGGAMGGNPIAGVNESGYSKERHKEMMAIFDVSYSPLKDWNIKGNIATYSHNTTYKDRKNTYYLYDNDGNIAKTENQVSSLKETNTYNFRTQLQFTSDYSFKIAADHNFKVLAGYSQEYYKSDGFWASRDKLPFDGIDVLNTGSDNKQNGSADGNGNEYSNDVAVQSWFGRLNYDYQGKYLFEASLRADGSSRFAKGHRWGVFPSFSGGWNIHREAFMMPASNWLSELKVRASWGILGDAEKVGYYPTAQILSYDPKIYAFNDKLVGGAYNNIAVNPNITWEESKYTNFGLDFGVLDQRIKLSADYFINLRDNILYRPPVPSEFGLNAPYSNLLKMKNQGMDILTSYQDSKGDFRWGVDVNLSYSKNKVLEMGDSERWIEDNNKVTYLNDRYQLPYGYEAIGLFQSEEEIAGSPDQGNVLPGNIKFKDQNNDNVIDEKDRVVLNRKIPVNFGMNLSFGYKDFDFSMNMYGKLNFKKYLQGYEGWAFYLTDNARPMHLDAWSETNRDASYPRLTLSNTANDYDSRYNSFWLRTADYLKIQNIQIGYTVPKSALERVNIQYLRLYLSGQNLATITGYDGFDPEGGWYPLARTFSFGFNLQF